MTRAWLDARPIVVAVAGPNGAGKTTFYESFLASAGLRFVNADRIALALGLDAYEAAGVSARIRSQLLSRRESFVFETVFSDTEGSKLGFLEEAAQTGYSVTICFVGVSSARVCDERVAMRVSKGGHDVAPEKLTARYPRTMANLRRAVRRLPHVLVYDNDDLSRPYRLVAEFTTGSATFLAKELPRWLRGAIGQTTRP